MFRKFVLFLFTPTLALAAAPECQIRVTDSLFSDRPSLEIYIGEEKWARADQSWQAVQIMNEQIKKRKCVRSTRVSECSLHVASDAGGMKIQMQQDGRHATKKGFFVSPQNDSLRGALERFHNAIKLDFQPKGICSLKNSDRPCAIEERRGSLFIIQDGKVLESFYLTPRIFDHRVREVLEMYQEFGVCKNAQSEPKKDDELEDFNAPTPSPTPDAP